MQKLKEEHEDVKSQKYEFEQLCEKLKLKLERKKAKETFLKENLGFKDQELDKKEHVLRKLSQTSENA